MSEAGLDGGQFRSRTSALGEREEISYDAHRLKTRGPSSLRGEVVDGDAPGVGQFKGDENADGVRSFKSALNNYRLGFM